MKRRGRKKKYGKKVKPKSLVADRDEFQIAESPVYGERNTELVYRTVDLFWRPVGVIVRFVLVIHPTRGRLILMSTDVELDALRIVELYGIRFKIEVPFKVTVHGHLSTSCRLDQRREGTCRGCFREDWRWIVNVASA